MAFSTNQMQYLNAILAASADKYPDLYYVAWNESVSSGSSDPDLHIIMSNSQIQFTEKGFDKYVNDEVATFIGDGLAVRYDIKTSNSSGYNPDLTNRIEFVPYGTGETWNVMIPGYNTIYTNCDYTTDYTISIFGDAFTAEGGYNYAQQEGQGIALGVIGALCVLTVFFIAFFRR